MTIRSLVFLRSGVVVLALFSSSLPASAQGGFGGLLGRATGRGNAPEAPAAAPAGDAEGNRNEGTIEDYLEMRAFAEGLYHQLDGTGDHLRPSEFKRHVDKAFETANKEDMRRAYEMNISAKSEVRYVIEDRFRIYTGLYDNPVVQASVNRVGQSVISSKIPRLYTFKLVADPVPWAESLSTGTIWVSTGMVALMKTKAQLAYVLAHEAAHIYLNHHRQRLMLQFAQEEYNQQLQQNGENRRRRTMWVGALVGAVASGVTTAVAGGGASNAAGAAVLGGVLGSAIGGAIANATNPALLGAIEWNRFEEDEADRLAMDWLLDANIDVKQVPAVYVALRDVGDRDPRAKLGFLGRTDRVRERLAAVQARLQLEQSQPGWASRRFEVSDPDFDLLLAEVQRDNGVFAFHYDMLETARENLRGAVAVKTQDPTALYFYARVLSQTARTTDERKEADDYFLKAAQNDYRNHNYGTYLHRAIEKLTPDASGADKAQAVEFLKLYVIGYYLSGEDQQAAKTYNLPPHLEMVYDYLARAGELRWRFDDATVKRVRDAVAKGIPLVEYRDVTAKDATAPRPKTTVEKVRAQEPAKPEPPKQEPPKPKSGG